MKITILLMLALVVMSVASKNKKKPSKPFYTENDDVVILDADNFESKVMKSDHSWVVMFYSQWCGHCREFAPTYKKLATDMKKWGSFIKLAAFDCSTKSPSGKDNGMSVCFKKPYFVGGMPDCRIFPPGSDRNSKGVRRQFAGRKTYGSDGKIKEDSDSFENVRGDILNLLQDNHLKDMDAGPNLDFLKRKDLDAMMEKEDNLVLVIEPRKSIVGKLIVMDVAGDRTLGGDVRVGRVSKRNKKAVKRVEEQLEVEVQSNVDTCAVVSLKREKGSGAKLVYFNQDPEEFRKRVVQELRSGLEKDGGEDGSKEDEEESEEEEEGDKKSGGETSKVYMSDLEAALHYSLRKEVSGKERVSGDDLINLKNFISIVKQFFPGRKSTMKFLRKVDKLVRKREESIEWEDWQEILARAKHTVGSYLPSSDDYKSCDNFPCSFWQLFHVIMTQFYRTAPDMDPFMVLDAMTGYMESFFTCEVCRRNWKHESDDMRDFVDSPSTALIYLWKKHNSVNRRLGKDAWPSKTDCPKCWTDKGIFDLDEVERHLADYYHFENISAEGVREEGDDDDDDEEAGKKDEL